MTDFVPPSSPRSDAEPTRVKAWSFRPWVAVVTLLAVGLFFGSCGTIAGVAIGSPSQSKGALKETLVDGKPEATQKIAVIKVEGMIMETMGAGGTVTRVAEALKQIEDDETVVGVLLAIDTPGGGVTASDRIYHDLLEFKKRTQLPIHALFYDVAASGGYYVAMASDHITAHPTSITGSIGVISKFYNVSDAMGKVGVSVNVVKSLNSKGEVSFKDIGSPYRPMQPQERALLQGLVTEMWDRFTNVVIAGRSGKLEAEKVRQLADGRVFTGEQARALGLIDAVGYSQDAYTTIREAAQAPEAKIVAYGKEPGLKELIGLAGTVGPPQGSLAAQAVSLLSDQGSFLYLWSAASFTGSP